MAILYPNGSTIPEDSRIRDIVAPEYNDPEKVVPDLPCINGIGTFWTTSTWYHSINNYVNDTTLYSTTLREDRNYTTSTSIERPCDYWGDPTDYPYQMEDSTSIYLLDYNHGLTGCCDLVSSGSQHDAIPRVVEFKFKEIKYTKIDTQPGYCKLKTETWEVSTFTAFYKCSDDGIPFSPPDGWEFEDGYLVQLPPCIIIDGPESIFKSDNPHVYKLSFGPPNNGLPIEETTTVTLEYGGHDAGLDIIEADNKTTWYAGEEFAFFNIYMKECLNYNTYFNIKAKMLINGEESTECDVFIVSQEKCSAGSPLRTLDKCCTDLDKINAEKINLCDQFDAPENEGLVLKDGTIIISDEYK